MQTHRFFSRVLRRNAWRFWKYAAARVFTILSGEHGRGGEAHFISRWGHDFRAPFHKLQGLKSQLGNIPNLALTATATPRVAADLVLKLGMIRPDGFKGSFFRPNLILNFQKTIFCRLERDADTLTFMAMEAKGLRLFGIGIAAGLTVLSISAILNEPEKKLA